MPLMSLLLGELIDAAGKPTSTTVMVHGVFKVSLKFVYLALGACAASFLQVSSWTLTGERQAARIRSLYLKTILRQEIGFFDKETSTGEIVGRMSGDTILIQEAMGEKVASYTGEQLAISKYNKSLIKAYKSSVQQGLATGLGMGIVMFISYCGYGLAVWFGGRMIIDKGYTGGDVLIVIFGVLLGSASLGQASPSLSAFAAGQAAAFKMFEAINRRPDIDAYDTNGRKLDEIRGDIELKDVSFSYPARPDEQILIGFSLSIPSGTTAALVGQSGSGKSTVISLIDRFYDPQAGEVLIDGVNLREFQLKWIREKIGLVSQEPVLFSSSIRDNIAYGKIGATNKEIEAAAELANAANFINKLPQGLDTMVGEHGIQLSGGQKQRVAIARATLKDSRILLLDEATSALDAESERVVQEALERVMVNRTTVLVAHRLTTVRKADMIAVIEKGKIVEKGSHFELLKDHDGAYSQLIRLQEIGKESQKDASIQSDSGRHSWVQYVASPISRISDRSPEMSPEKSPEKSIDSTPASEKPQISQQVSLSRLARLNSPEIPMLILGSIFAAANGVILPIFGMVLASVIKTFYEPEEKLKRDSSFWALIFVAIGVACFLSFPMSSYFFGVAGCKLIKRIRSMCFEKVVHMEIGWFDEAEHSSGAIGARLSSDAASVRSSVGDTLALLVQNAATAAAGLIIGFKTNWELSLIILAFFPLLGLSAYGQMKAIYFSSVSGNDKKMYEEASQVVSDAVGSIRTVASFCTEEKVIELYQKKCDGPVKAKIKQGLIRGLCYGLSFFFFFFIYAVEFFIGGILVNHGRTTFNDFFHVFFALSMTAFGISRTTSLAPDVAKAKSSSASVFGLLDQISKIDSSDNTGTTLDNVRGEVELRHVSFKYPTRPDTEIFHDLCLTIHSGKMVALVGESGSGKSTVISLLQRFYDPNSGHITLDGIEIQRLQLKWLRQQMGLVSQEPVLFNDTIRANIAYGKEGDATESEILVAAELANAHSFISGLQQGYDTSVGERGIQLSGGQKQRVAIARAIVKAPKLLLLDEATSALDLESERVVQDALDRVMKDRTTIMVAHRLSTIRNADVIAVIKDGVIVEKGNHETIINVKNGVYASLLALHTSASN
ncbi:ABC transporter B family member 21-like [Pistacia vera]|uniref:ABC transporter B family member 21-like n=1 Tax=Pistacia vera TaxID=55513 RepID=UPI0012632545|nr:ABC transporter B family member 21-like [Pistacia vera]